MFPSLALPNVNKEEIELDLDDLVSDLKDKKEGRQNRRSESRDRNRKRNDSRDRRRSNSRDHHRRRSDSRDRGKSFIEGKNRDNRRSRSRENSEEI